MSLISITVILFLLMDSIGNVSPFLTLMQGIDPKRQKIILLREMCIALATMIVFNYLGNIVFSLLGICSITARLTSGIIIFLVAIKIIFPSSNGLRSNLPQGEPFIIPLAIPLIAGPSVLATIMLFALVETSHTVMLAAIILAWLGSFVILLLAPFLKRVLQSNGLLALEKLIGMILVLLAVQRFAEGIQEFIVQNTCQFG